MTTNSSAVNAIADNSTAIAEPFGLRCVIRIDVRAPVIISLPIEISITDGAPDYLAQERVRPRVVLGGVNVTARLVDELTVEAEEGMARTAAFTISPLAGAVDLDAWFGASVIIDHDILSSVGAVTHRRRIFTGIVDTPIVDPASGRVTFECSDGLQSVIDGRSREDIDTLTPGAIYVDALSGAEADGWDYLQARLESIPATVDLGADRVPRLSEWAAKQSPDYTFTVAIDGTEVVDLSSSRTGINEVEITFTYRFLRLRERVEFGSWSHPALADFCVYLTDTTELPNRDMILGALRATGWLPTSVNFTPLPGPATFDCGGPVIWVPEKEAVDQLVLGATWTLKRRFSQPIEEVYTIRVQAPSSIASRDVQRVQVSAGFSSEFDAAAWVQEINETSQIRATGEAGDALVGSQQLGGSGDYFIDKTDAPGFSREDAEAAIDYLIASARRNILSAHRQSLAGFATMINPEIDLVHTVRLQTPRITAQGKVRRVVHTYDLREGGGESGTRTEIQIAISRNLAPAGQSFAISTTPAVIPPPAPISTDPGNVPVLTTNARSTHLGGDTGSPEFDDEWRGFVGNYNTIDPGAELYPTMFRIQSPQVNEVDVSPATWASAAEYAIGIPNDDLAVTMP